MDTSNGAQAGREDRDDNFRWHSLIWFIRNRKHPFSNSQILCRIMLTYLQDHNDFRPSCSSGKESAWKCRRHRRLGFDPWVGKIPRVGSGNLPTPVFLPGKSHGQRSLVGYSPCGCKESDMTEQLMSMLFVCIYSFTSLETNIKLYHWKSLVLVYVVVFRNLIDVAKYNRKYSYSYYPYLRNNYLFLFVSCIFLFYKR